MSSYHVQAEKAEKHEQVQAKVGSLRATVAKLKEKNRTLRAKYHVLLDM